MFEQVKNELSHGKKVYIFEVLSMIGFIVFLMLGDKIPVLATTILGNVIMFGWILINILVAATYVVYEFSKILMKDKIVEGNIVRHLLIKFVFFVMLFMINMFPITMLMLIAGGRMGLDMSLPILALMVGLLIVCIARKTIPSAKALTLLGVLWFVTAFIALYFLSPLLFVGITSIVKQEMVASTILSIVCFSAALGIFYHVIKRMKLFLEEK